MAIILLFNISPIKINNRSLDEDDQRKLFGDTFEKLGQARRINVLFSLNVIDKKVRDYFIEIKKIRNKYLHFFSKEHVEIRKDSNRIFSKTEDIVVEVMGQEIKDEYFVLRQDIMSYLEQHECFI